MSGGTGTSHFKLHGLVGLGMIVGLPFAIYKAACAIPNGVDGFKAWLSTPMDAIGFALFFIAAAWYCKLEFDEVVMDYFDGGLKTFALLANKLVLLLITLAVVFTAYKLAF
ncbi:MAG: hypothetical protein ACPGVT_09750 [Maricaulaceae bacterium]